jgi:hypothetical protein
MSCRIERLVKGDDPVVLRVCGHFDGEHVDMLRELLGRENGNVAIDLVEVIVVDRSAVSLLALSETNGIELRNCPAYIREWVARERAHIGAQQTGRRTEDLDDVENL